MGKPRAAVSWSGGKDSYLALNRARRDFDVAALITMFTEDGTRSRSHGLRPEVLRRQAELLQLELLQGRGSWQSYEANFKKLLRELREQEFSHVVFGDIFLDDHKHWVERVCSEIGLIAIEPLWEQPTSELLLEFFNLKGEARIVATNAALLDESWLGRTLSPELLVEFQKLRVDPCGEYGEYHTLVTSSPCLTAPLTISETGHHLHDGYWMLDVVLRL